MTPQPLHRPFIGIQVLKDDYCKIEGLLPQPSYHNTITSSTGVSIALVYVIDGYITSPKQYKQISDIKLAIKDNLIVKFSMIEEFYISEYTQGDGMPYTLQELRTAFKSTYRAYPKIYFPPDKKSLYRHLIIHGKKLRYANLFTLDAMISSALLMNKALKDPLSIKELHKKVKGAYGFILEHLDQFPVSLGGAALKAAHSSGGKKRKAKQKADTHKQIMEAIATGDYTKANGKVNVSKLSKSLNINRSTIWRHLQD